MENNLFPFVNLKSFPNGWRWHGKLKEFIKVKCFENLKAINDNKIDRITAFLNGSILTSKLFQIFNWVIYFNPIPSLEIYFLCERSKKGDNFNIFFGKESIKIPTEEIYGFALIYASVLSFAGKKSSFIQNSISDNEFLSLSSINLEKDKLKNFIYEKCNNFNLDNKEVLEKIEDFPILDDYTVKNKALEIILQPFSNLFYKYNFKDGKADISVSKESLDFYPVNLVLSLAGLLSNSLKREYSK